MCNANPDEISEEETREAEPRGSAPLKTARSLAQGFHEADKLGCKQGPVLP